MYFYKDLTYMYFYKDLIYMYFYKDLIYMYFYKDLIYMYFYKDLNGENIIMDTKRSTGVTFCHACRTNSHQNIRPFATLRVSA
jgi:hypothetical protein